MRGDLVDQTIEVLPTSRRLRETLQSIDERPIAGIGPYSIAHDHERLFWTSEIVFPNRCSFGEKRNAIGVGRRQLDPLRVQAHNLLEVAR